MKIKLFIDYISQPSRAVLVFCKIHNIPVEIQQVRIAKLQHLQQEYTKINPMKKVPAIHDPENGLMIGQSHAIMSYLSRKFKHFQLFKPNGDQVILAKVEEYLHYHHANTRKCALLLYTNLFSKLYPVQQSTVPDPKILQAQVEGILNFINQHYFKDSEFLIGKTLTVADLAAYFEIETLELIGYDFNKFQKISKWMKVIQNIKQIKETDANYKKTVPKMKLLKASL